nr:MAG TPA: hypothetical protein [Caudoviricetes sp.]
MLTPATGPRPERSGGFFMLSPESPDSSRF